MPAALLFQAVLRLPERILQGVACVGVSSAEILGHAAESPRRATMLVTRTIVAAAARVGADRTGVLSLACLDQRRDWGWAPNQGDVMAREGGREAALRHAAVADDGRDRIEVDRRSSRAMDAPLIVGDTSKARRELGWPPTLDFDEIVGRMSKEDFERWAAGA